MSTGTMHPRRLGHGVGPTGWLVGIIVVLLAALAGLAIFRSAPAPGAETAELAEPIVAADPAQAGVMGYVAAHELAKPVVAADPAQAGVLGYVAAHELAEPVAAADPAQAGVLGYVAAHELAEPVAAADPAQAGVMTYLQAHGARP